MSHFRNLFLGRTNRRDYWLILLASALVLFGAWMTKDETRPAVIVAVMVTVQLVEFVATARRLHDAGWSRWWLVLYLFPMSITWDLMRVQLGTSMWNFVDVSAAIRLIPVVMGLLSPTRSTVRGRAAQRARVTKTSAA